MGETEEFNPLTFEKRLTQLKDTQECIQGLSSWCLKQREHHKKIVASWLNVLKRVKVEQRLVLFYLANDVIQYSKRKNIEFVKSWGLNLQKATPLVRDEKVRHKILRIFKIWEQRSVYDEEFLSDLTGLLSAGTKKSSDDDALDFQPQQLVNKIKQCTVLEADTDLRLKNIHENKLDFSDTEQLCSNLKDRSIKDDVVKELNDGIGCVERYTAALQREIVAREALLALLSSANQYYSTQRGEVKVVAYAYKNFGSRVRALKRKLDELTPKLPDSVPSPPPRDEDVPSPAPDDDLELPQPDPGEENDIAYNIDRTFNTSVAEDGSLYNLGLSSFLTSDNPLSLFNESLDNINSSANRIEVISSRAPDKPDFNVNDFFKTLAPNDSNMNSAAISDNNSATSASLSQKSQETLPGLDLLPTDGHIAPPSSFYGTIEINDDPEPAYSEPETPPLWNNNAWSMPQAPAAAPPHAIFVDTPASPPPAPPAPPAPPRGSPRTTASYTPAEPPLVDVDHRGILPPPPPPPVLPLLGNLFSDIEDVDHRLLPGLPDVRQPPPHQDGGDVDQRLFPSTPPNLSNIRQPLNNQDVDHRNLISLTQMNQPPPMPVAPPIINLDQDYRVPTMVPPPDIVESVDMDLSDDEDTQFNPDQRRQSFNNKVLVGGSNGKTNHEQNSNLMQINNTRYDNETKEAPMSAPVMPPMSNPFDKLPQFPFELPNNNFEQQNFEEYNDSQEYDEVQEMADAYEEDMRSRGLVNRSMSHESDRPRHGMNQRFPRNWSPRTNMRPPFGNQQFWPRNGPRPPNRWMGPRPQRFW